jgi:nucleotide-binding universal stress UspA family protein
MRQIIVPTDFSENASNAIDYALNLAKVYHSSLTIYHACQLPTSSIHRPAPSFIEQEKQTIIKETRQKLKAICHKYREYGVICNTEMSISPVFDGIIDASEKTGADLIVMGTKGSSGLSRWLFGSQTADVIQNSLIPVLAIPGQAKYRPVNKIVFATDYRDSDFDFIRKLVKLAARFGSELHILHVQTEEGEFRSEALFEYFRNRVKSVFDYGKIHFHLAEKENVVAAINSFATGCEAEMISMATSRRNLFERIFSRSMTREMAYITKIPLLAFNT